MFTFDTFQVFEVTPTRAPSYSVNACVPKVKAHAGCNMAAMIWLCEGLPCVVWVVHDELGFIHRKEGQRKDKRKEKGKNKGKDNRIANGKGKRKDNSREKGRVTW